MKIEKLIITGLDNVTDPQIAIRRSAGIAKRYANRNDLINNKVSVNWENNTEAIAWSDHRKKLTYSFE